MNPNTGEGCIVELPDGSLYANSRREGPRLEARSFDGGETFDFKTFKTSDTLRSMLGGTAAALLGIPKDAWGRDAVLFSNQSFFKEGNAKWSIWHRKELMISLSVDGCKTWPVRKLIYEGATGYSSTALTKEGDVVVLYEKGKGHYRDTGLSVAIFNKEWLLGSKKLKDLK